MLLELLSTDCKYLILTSKTPYNEVSLSNSCFGFLEDKADSF